MPPALVAIAARFDEFQKLLVRDVVPLDRKRRHLGAQRWTLVVPTERNRSKLDAERRLAVRNLDPFAARRRTLSAGPVPGARRPLPDLPAWPHPTYLPHWPPPPYLPHPLCLTRRRADRSLARTALPAARRCPAGRGLSSPAC